MNIFQPFSPDDIVRANPTEVSTGLWTGDTGSLTRFYTSSAQTGSTQGQYEWDVYNINPSSSDAEVQFAIAYGHVDGGGATTLDTDDNALLPTKATYFQYRNILLEPGDELFTFLPDDTGQNFDADEIFVINIKRQRLKEKLDPGNWELTVAFKTGSIEMTNSFIDDSSQTLGEQFGQSGRVFNVVSGTLSGVSNGTEIRASSSVSGGFGLVYPDLGIIVLNPRALLAVSGCAVTDVATTAHMQNQLVLLQAMAGAGNTKYGSDTSDFQARSSEHISSTHFFVRLRNKDFNYTNNPSFFSETDGTILNPDFVNDPRVYVTTVGLYNDDNELLAVAKLSQPLAKAYDREALLRVRLDFVFALFAGASLFTTLLAHGMRFFV